MYIYVNLSRIVQDEPLSALYSYVILTNTLISCIFAINVNVLQHLNALK